MIATEGWTCIDEQGRWVCLGGRGPEGTQSLAHGGPWIVEADETIVQMAVDPDAAQGCALGITGRLWCTTEFPYGMLLGDPIADDASHVAARGDVVCYARRNGDLVCRERGGSFRWAVMRMPSPVVEVALSLESVCGRLHAGTVACVHLGRLPWKDGEAPPLVLDSNAPIFIEGVTGATRLFGAKTLLAAIVPSKVAPTTEVVYWRTIIPRCSPPPR